MKSSLTHKRNCLIIFTRYPVPGKSKTRLISLLGPAGAADLHRRLTEKTFATVSAFSFQNPVSLEIRFKGGSVKKMQRWLGKGIKLSPQVPGDLGRRMHSAFSAAFEAGFKRVVLLGTDIPDIHTTHLKQAFKTLSGCDVVIGPSTDGGYWLIGLKRPEAIFRGIQWGTNRVFGQTMALVESRDLKVRTLQQLTDMDSPADLRQWLQKEAIRRPYISIIIPARNESARIKKTVSLAKNEDAEIIVVDGGSTDDTVNLAIKAGAKVLKSRPGRAAQQNLGTRYARGQVLLFLHADTLLPKGYIRHIFETLIEQKVVAGAFRFKTDLQGPIMKLIELVANFRSRYLGLPYGDQALCLRRSIFDSTAGFPDVPLAEDLFFIRSLGKHGRIAIAPAYALTSARRWRTLGVFRTTLINYIILAGCYVGISPNKLARLYKWGSET
jgi:rSAM/selenodomain-associated transferase 2/rSAM/selenodomain-associated transferase 1